MKTLKELFTEAGVSEEAQVKFNELLKGGHTNGGDLEVVIANNGEYVKADKYDGLRTQYEALKTEKEGLSQKISEYDALTSKYNNLETEYKDFKAKSNNNEVKLRKQFEIEKRLIGSNLPTVNGSYKAYIDGVDLEKITVNVKGEFEGIDDVYNDFKAKNKTLIEKFNTQVIPPDNGMGKPTDKKLDHNAFLKMNYEERVALKEKDPATYERISKK